MSSDPVEALCERLATSVGRFNAEADITDDSIWVTPDVLFECATENLKVARDAIAALRAMRERAEAAERERCAAWARSDDLVSRIAAFRQSTEALPRPVTPGPWETVEGEYDCGDPCTINGCHGHPNGRFWVDHQDDDDGAFVVEDDARAIVALPDWIAARDALLGEPEGA